jgi:predicted ATP-grasp superfamily ATP-dependent carboligase
MNRPLIETDERGHRRITWPSTQLSVASPPGSLRDVILLRGIEPNMRWRQFCAELLAASDELGAQMVVTLGALLADTPHTRPVPVSGTASEPEIADRLKLEQSNYEGPTGIVGVFQDACVQADIPAVSFWAAVPHYVAQPPCPKATLALLGQLEDVLELSIPMGDLPEDARAWERGVDELAADDEEIGDYVRALEETRDTADLPEASGEAIAREFERYLKRREHPDD